MHLDATHTVYGHEPAPDGIDPLVVWQEGHRAFDGLDALARFGSREIKAVAGCWPCTDVPELGDILHTEIQFRPLPF